MAAFERATVGLFIWWSANTALATSPSRAPSISRFDVAETVERIASGAPAHGLTVLERTDHSGIAERDGYRLHATQSLLVDGVAGGEPVKLVVWQSRSGVTMVSLERHSAAQPRSCDEQLPRLLGALAPAWPELTPG